MKRLWPLCFLLVASCGEKDEAITYNDIGMPTLLIYETITNADKENQTVFALSKTELEKYREFGSITTLEFDSAMAFISAVETFEDYLLRLRRDVISRREGVEASITDTMKFYRMVHLNDTSGMTLDEMMNLQTELRMLERTQSSIPRILGVRNMVYLDVDEYWLPDKEVLAAWYYMNFPGKSLYGVVVGLDAVKLKVSAFKCKIMRILLADIKERDMKNQKIDSIQSVTH